jgi:hypothetical protein
MNVQTRRRGFLAPALTLVRGAGRASGAAVGDPGPLRQAVLLALAAGLAGFTILQGISPHDEGLMLQAGARIAAGQLPYRDFWMNYPPGQPLVLAGLQKLFGPSLLTWRVVVTATDAIVALLAYRLTRRRAPEIYALGAWLAACRGRTPSRWRSRSGRCWPAAVGRDSPARWRA